MSDLLAAWSGRFEEALVAALAEAARRRAARQSDSELAAALIEALRAREAPIDRFFFDWRGGRDPGDRALSGRAVPRRWRRRSKAARAARTHPYWSDEAPCSMHIDEVEAIWSAIAERDDWQPFNAKVAAVRRMGEAMAQDAPQLDHDVARPREPAPEWPTLISTDPATGEQFWSGEIGDADAEVAAARAAWPAWAAQPLAYRIETLRRFANVVRKKEAEFAELIARETGKPLWEARTEVGAVVNKVEISIAAYAERTAQRRLEAAMGNKIAVRHKPHGVLAVLGPYNFPAHLPNGHIVPALIAGNAVVFKPSEKTPATGEFLVRCFHEAGVPEGVIRLLVGGPDEGKALAAQPGIDGLLFTGSARAGQSLHRHSPKRRRRSSRSRWAATIRSSSGTPRMSTPRR